MPPPPARIAQRCPRAAERRSCCLRGGGQGVCRLTVDHDVAVGLKALSLPGLVIEQDLGGTVIAYRVPRWRAGRLSVTLTVLGAVILFLLPQFFVPEWLHMVLIATVVPTLAGLIFMGRQHVRLTPKALTVSRHFLGWPWNRSEIPLETITEVSVHMGSQRVALSNPWRVGVTATDGCSVQILGLHSKRNAGIIADWLRHAVEKQELLENVREAVPPALQHLRRVSVETSRAPRGDKDS